MQALRSLAFNLGFFLVTALLAIFGLPAFLMPRGATRLLYNLWARAVIGLLRICGVRCRIEGQHCILPSPAIYAVKHQSALDIFLLILALGNPVFVMKRELLWIPLVGMYFKRAGMIPINRKRGVAAMRATLRAARRKLRAGQPIVIFPEGTRTRPGQSPRYLSGAAALYTQLHVPVVPVALNTGLVWGKNAWRKRPGEAVMQFLPAIAPGMQAKEFTAMLQHVTEAATENLLNP